MSRSSLIPAWALLAGSAMLQGQQAPDLQALMAGNPSTAALPAALPTTPLTQPRVAPPTKAPEKEALEARQADQIAQEIQAMKKAEKGPKRFAADLFEFRQALSNATEGGIADDYVLGTGDQLQLSVFGSATFETPLTVDGRGEVVVPKVGTVKVGGMSLGKARNAVQAKVTQNYSRSSVDMSVIKLREVRVFVLGEVYKPGSYLVPSLSSLVNVLGLAGGPTAAGSYRQVRVQRGGKIIHTLDLYPLRAEGLGNMNFSLQNGDTVFVPLALNQIRLEGAFTRVVAVAEQEMALEARKNEERDDSGVARAASEEQRKLQLQIRVLDTRLGREGSSPRNENAGGGLSSADRAAALPPLTPVERLALEEERQNLQDRLEAMKQQARGDQRVLDQDRAVVESTDQPRWLTRWMQEGKAPLMQFELLPGETVGDALRFAGGLVAQAFGEGLSLRRLDAQGGQVAFNVALPTGAPTPLQRGDVLSALPQRGISDRSVRLEGWIRVPGVFARTENLRVADLLKQQNQVLPDTYLGRGELVRTHVDGSTAYQSFDLAKALQGDPAHNLLLEDRDRLEFYRRGDLRLRQTVQVMGPVTRPGTFEFHAGMRASDLIFRAGVPLRSADRLVAELAHTRDGKVSEIRRLDLARLATTEQGSPTDLKDDAVNPLVEPYDQLSFYEKPDYRPHRVVKVSGQVARPGTYALDRDDMSLKDLIERAGGLTPEAMPKGGIFLRRMGTVDPEKLRAAQALGLENADPTGNGINEILGRLSEVKRQPTTGTLIKTPLLHGLALGTTTRMVINFEGALAGDREVDVSLQDGDEVIIPRKTDTAYVVGETASPFAAYKIKPGTKVGKVIELAGGTTRNADTWNIRLLKADGRILDSWVSFRKVEPGDAILVPPRVKRDVAWQDNMAAIANLAIAYAAIKP